MKKNTLRRMAAALAATTLLVSAMPAVNLSADAAKNIVSNSTFETGTSGWGTYKERGGECTLSTKDGQLALTVANVGKVNYSVQVYYDIVPLYKNGVYRLKYDISSTVDRFVEGMIQMNGGDYRAYTWKGLNLTSTPQTVDYTFTMEEDTDIMAKFLFNCGIQEADGELPEHTIFIDNVSLELIDDSAVDYAASRPYEPQIITNQVGYKTDSKKVAVFRKVNGASKFNVVNADTKQVVYSGDLKNETNNTSADETDWQGDFSSVKTPGKYYITCEGLDDSYTFEIGDGVYNNMIDDSVRMLYLQRCGCAVEDKDFSHPACHNEMATVLDTGEKIDVTGGWHDAGDYGRYVVPAAKAVADLLYAYDENPSLYGDSIGIPESGNGTADVLDEARYELEWMLKMQRADGGVYHKVSCESFPGYVMPEKETEALIVTPVSTTATGDFCAAMALAYEYYKDVDGAFADKCLKAAENAWDFLEKNPNLIFENPKSISTGEYGDKSDTDERYWAAAQLFRATGDSKYQSYLSGKAASTGLDWATVGDYGNIALLTSDKIDKTSDAYTKAKAAVLKQADKFLSNSTSSPYGVALTKFDWGSNMTVANAGIILSLASQITGEAKYAEAAEAQLNYLLGENPVGTSFMTGYGTVSPEHPHHRPSMAVGKAMPGMLVGGVNSNLEDSAAKAYCQDLPAAKRYVDNSESYSTNEITIYWNSPLTYLLTLTDSSDVEPVIETPETTTTVPVTVDPTEIKWGDANCDGEVTAADATTILQYLGNRDKYDLTEQGKRNADVYDNGDGITALDALSIQKLDARVISSLPESYSKDSETTAVTTTEAQTTAAPETTTTAKAETVKIAGFEDKGTPMNENATMVADFRKGETSYFFASDGWPNGNPFDCVWYKENTSFKDGVLNLTIDKDPSGKYNYSGGEYRTADHYGYGYYEVSMQAIKNDGVVSSFFTYTGPSEDNPWDEIDIEILGKDTTKVQFNRFNHCENGVSGNEYLYDLGFDASEAFHTYGFDWQPDHIAWFVDGKEVYRATDDIPSTPSRIMMNTWPGIGVNDWLKPFDGKTPLTARYQWVTYTANK